MSSGSASLQPTYHGHVATTHDALTLFEACLSGQLHHVPRRPHDRERSNLIRSGCVFIYEENASGIKRWTDGVPWSPSRILGNFLVYRELLKPFPPGEKKRATKRAKRTSKPGEPYPRPQADDGSPYSPTSPPPPSFRSSDSFDRETERSLIGSLVDSYGFKEGGLVKKTMSVNVSGVHHHLVSYYKVEDVLSGALETPSQSATLRYIKPRHDLTSRQNFRAPLDEHEEGMDNGMDPHRNPYGYGDRNSFERRPAVNNQGYPPPQAPPSHNAYNYPAIDGSYLGGPQPAPSVSTAYGVPAPAPTPATVQPYYAQNNVPHLQPKSEEYGPYGNAGPYPSGFESLHGHIGQVPAVAGDRAASQLQPMNYMQPQAQAQAQLRARPGNMPESPTLVEAKNASDGYHRGYYPGPSRPETATGTYAQGEAPRWTPPTTAARPENVPAYPQAAGKAGYWPMAGHVGNGHGHYPSPSSTPRWSNPSV